MKLSWVWTILIVTTLLGVTAENIYMTKVIDAQRHTIRQYMGLEDGPDATPQPPVMPPYVPPVGARTI